MFGGVPTSTRPKSDYEQLNFSQALIYLKEGFSIARRNWNGKDLAVKMQRPDEHSKMTAEYAYLETKKAADYGSIDSRIPWVPSQGDLFAGDWYVIKV